MFVYDKVVEEDKRGGDDPLQGEPRSSSRNFNLDQSITSDIGLADGSTVSLQPSALDAYAVFEDLCLLANSERPHFLKLEALPKTFALELIESVLTNYHKLFRHVGLFVLCNRRFCLTEFAAPRDPVVVTSLPMPPTSQVPVRAPVLPIHPSGHSRCVHPSQAILIRTRY